MAYTAGSWVSPKSITGTTKIADTDTILQDIVSDDPGSIKAYLDTEGTKWEDELNSYDTRVTALENDMDEVKNIVEW